MRVLVCGSRNWADEDFIYRELVLLQRTEHIDVIIEGGANGADKIAQKVAGKLNIPVEEYLADWQSYGKRAGHTRNYKMLTDGKPDIVLAFHDNILASKGTKHMVQIAERAGILTSVHHHVLHTGLAAKTQ